MKRLLFALLTLVLLAPPGVGSADKIKVVTTIPDLADMTKQVGGDLVDVTSLATGVEDIHAVPMKPSFAVTLNRADVVLLMGLEAEHAFLPALLEASRNPRIRRDGRHVRRGRNHDERSRKPDDGVHRHVITSDL